MNFFRQLFSDQPFSNSKESVVNPLEELLCDAIREGKIVEMYFESDNEYRLYAPIVVYHTSVGNSTSVYGLMLFNPVEFWERHTYRSYNLDDIKQVKLTDLPFSMECNFSSDIDEFKHGVICAVDKA